MNQDYTHVLQTFTYPGFHGQQVLAFLRRRSLYKNKWIKRVKGNLGEEQGEEYGE